MSILLHPHRVSSRPGLHVLFGRKTLGPPHEPRKIRAESIRWLQTFGERSGDATDILYEVTESMFWRALDMEVNLARWPNGHL